MKPSLYWIDAQVGLATLPHPRGSDWLEDELKALYQAGIRVLVSLLTPPEVDDLALKEEPALCAARGIAFVSFPIPDREVPSSARLTWGLVRELDQKLKAGQGVGIHCRSGIGRASLLAACILVSRGEAPDAAFAQIAEARGRPVPDVEEQRAWVDRFAQSLASGSLR